MSATTSRRPPLAEPTALRPLSWGDHQGRMVVGIGLIIGGAALVAQTTVYTIGLGLIGSALHVAGWAVQPGRRGTRALVALPSMLACWATISGPQTMWLLGLGLAAWLVVRERPSSSYVVLVLPLVVGLGSALVFSHAAEKSLAFALVLASVCAGAWLARAIAFRAPQPVLTVSIGGPDTECDDTP